MDPSYVTTAFWHELALTLRLLLLLVGFVFFFAGNMVVAHMVIPSLVMTGHAPEKLSRYRPLFYMAALAGAAGMVATFIVLSNIIQVLSDIYPRWWI